MVTDEFLQMTAIAYHNGGWGAYEKFTPAIGYPRSPSLVTELQTRETTNSFIPGWAGKW